jgi:hypothetical protein
MKINTTTIIIGAAVLAGGAYFLTRKRGGASPGNIPATPAVIVPNVASTAPQKTDWAGVAVDVLGPKVGQLMDKWLSTGDGGARAIYNEQGTGAVDLRDYAGTSTANAGIMDDSLGAWFGGAAPRFNWDNAGGSVFDGVPSLGTGQG